MRTGILNRRSQRKRRRMEHSQSRKQKGKSRNPKEPDEGAWSGSGCGVLSNEKQREIARSGEKFRDVGETGREKVGVQVGRPWGLTDRSMEGVTVLGLTVHPRV